MRLSYQVNVIPGDGVESLVLDLAAETKREELLLRLIERGRIREKWICKLNDGNILSATLVVEPPIKTKSANVSWA